MDACLCTSVCVYVRVCVTCVRAPLPRSMWLNDSAFRITFNNFIERSPLPWPSRTDLKTTIEDRVPDILSYPARTWPVDPSYRAAYKIGAFARLERVRLCVWKCARTAHF